DATKTTHAIGMAGVANVALRQTRAGELSMWKGCAFANAARNGVFAALLAAEGLTGPAPIFEGELGIMKLLTGPFTVPVLGGPGPVRPPTTACPTARPSPWRMVTSPAPSSIRSASPTRRSSTW